MSLSNKIIYQVYPKSFYDTTGNGMGDLAGVIQKLDYLEKLGIDMIWLNPFYPSPQNDNGYDISNYTAIDPLFGTMKDFEELIIAANQRNIDIMLDMVLNHTSTAHDWFKKALTGDKYYQDFYYLRPAKADGTLPTNWGSKFGGSAWEPFGDTDLYYLHLYDVTQADLNWHNPNVRQALFDVVNFWLAKGVKGLRFDVLNVIGKSENLVDSVEPNSIQEKRLYTDTPIVHEWIRELNQATFSQYDNIITVGEMSSTTIENGVKYSKQDGSELSMIFSFHHLKVDYEDNKKWSNPEFNFLELKHILDEWQTGLSDGNGWNALFLNNHDQPRSNSRFGDVTHFPFETQSMLAQTIQFLRGTPYIYQGEEIGMTNPDYPNIDNYNDIETINNYQLMLADGKSETEAMTIIKEKSRDNSRTPMQWNDSQNAGFTKGTPWLTVADNYTTINVKNAVSNNKLFSYYQQLIQLRKSNTLISGGSYRGLLLDDNEVMVYVRETGKQQLLILSHFYGTEYSIDLPKEFQGRQFKILISNYEKIDIDDQITLRPYETIALIYNK